MKRNWQTAAESVAWVREASGRLDRGGNPRPLTPGGRPGDTPLALDLLDPDATAKRLAAERLLLTHGAQRGLDVDLWAITTDQMVALLDAATRGTP